MLQLAAGLKAIGEKHTVVVDGKAQPATAGQVALAWVLAQGEDVIPIPGTTKEKVSANGWWSVVGGVEP